jgi:dTDP-4-dehydrorhamnose 3,5-epimerase
MEPILINKETYKDNRGYFQEILKTYEVPFNFKTKFTAMSYSKKNVIRGLHFQIKNKQAKIITVVKGKVLDVCVNLKKKSKYFGKVYKFLLTPGKVLIIPDYYAHGFECLSHEAYLFYHLNNYQNKNNEGGIIYNDKELKIKWKTKSPILSIRDKNLMSLKDFKKRLGTL